jgi:hypothetical protein
VLAELPAHLDALEHRVPQLLEVDVAAQLIGGLHALDQRDARPGHRADHAEAARQVQLAEHRPEQRDVQLHPMQRPCAGLGPDERHQPADAIASMIGRRSCG